MRGKINSYPNTREVDKRTREGSKGKRREHVGRLCGPGVEVDHLRLKTNKSGDP